MPDLPKDSEELVRAAIDAFNRGDLEALRVFVDDEISAVPMNGYAPPGTRYHGFDGLQSLTESWATKFTGLVVELKSVRSVGDGLVARIRLATRDGGAAVGDGEAFVLLSLKRGRIVAALGFDTEAEAVAAARRDGRPYRDGPSLTPREREIFQLLAQGLTGRQIAERLVLSPDTVRTHVQNGIGRLGAKTRGQAIAIALQRGDISL
jgi:DNA-binding CsgD family transcriptional regulator